MGIFLFLLILLSILLICNFSFQFVTYPPNDEKCVNADGCLECWAACQDTYFSTGYNELCVENVDEKCVRIF